MKYTLEELKEIKDYALGLTDSFVEAINILKNEKNELEQTKNHELDKKQKKIDEMKSVLEVIKNEKQSEIDKIKKVLD